MRCNRGQHLAEVLIALGIFFILVTAVLTITTRSFNTVMRARERRDAALVINEALEAVQHIASTQWASLVDGTYGLNRQGATWQLQASPDMVNGLFTRTLIVAPIARNTDCAVVSSGGTNDPNTKYITTTLAWQSNQRQYQESSARLFTNWKDTAGCILPTQADSTLFTVSTASLDETKKTLANVKVKNTGQSAITIDRMTLTWTKPGKITYLMVDGSYKWHSSNNIGTPQGAQPSGTELDIVDVSIQPGVEYSFTRIRFDSKMDGATMTVSARMSDGSTVTTAPFSP